MTLPSSSGRIVWLVTQAYHRFLVLYPARFRAQYEQEMKSLFEECCLEAYQQAGTVGVGRWLLKILIREAISLYKEYMDMLVNLFENQLDARKALRLGTVFLAGTWIALFFFAETLVSGFIASPLPGAFLVLTNALLVARALIHSERMEYVSGMAAMINTFLIASLMAVQAGFGRLPLMSILIQVLLLGLHGVLLWQLRGENLAREPQEFEKGN